MSNLAERLAALSPEQREALMRRMKAQGALPQPSQAASDTRSGPIAPAARDGDLPLSFAQQRLWVLDQIDPGSSTYNVFFPLRLSGPLDIEALSQSINTIVERHEALRTMFSVVAQRPSQVILPSLHIPLPVTDLRHLPEATREAEALRLTNQEIERPFDLAQGPLLRTMLLRLDAHEHILVLTMHHIVSDAWSMDVLFRELTTLYAAFRSGQSALSAALSALPIQYVDFAVWQRQWLQGAALERQLAYWRSQLAGAPPLELPTDHARPPAQTYRGATLSLALPSELRAALQRLSQREGATLFMTLLAAFNVLLARYSGQADICVGTPIANRTHSQTEDLIGFFVNTLVLRSDVSGNPSFRELLGRVRETTLQAQAHQDLPFELLVEALQPERDLSRTPLFQVMFTFENAGVAALDLPGVRASFVETAPATAKFDLTWTLREEAGNLVSDVNYNTDLFAEAAIARMIGHYQVVLAQMAADPERPIMAAPLLSAAEARSLVAAQAALPAFPAEGCLHDLFAEQATRTPYATAVQYDDQTLTYRDLDQRANQIAHYLQRLGVGAGVLVGLCVERSLDLVVGALAILKAGGAYVPIDPTYPAERIDFIVSDTQAPVVLTQSHLSVAWPTEQARVVHLDGISAQIANCPQTAPDHWAGAAHPAYVIYTSGSTGTPKGVLVSHANVARLFAATQPWFGFDSSDVWSMFHSFAFDFSVWELWGALLYGGQLVVVPYLTSRSPEEFALLLANSGVTVLNQTPSAFVQLAGVITGADNPLTALRLIIFGGEALDPRSLRPWFARYGDTRPQLVNMYGITETTVHVTYRPITAADAETATISPIGNAIPDLSVFLLDRYGHLLPDGIPGEIHVGGAGLAQGYLGRPALTAERFVPNPFSAEPGARLYRAGDLARRRADGELEYLGRTDRQVKIRGFRVELGEIEAVVSQHPAVQTCLVMAREDVPGDQRLIAYIVPSQEQRTKNKEQESEKSDSQFSILNSQFSGELRDWLTARLPKYMVPSAFVPLEAFPLTSNGKIDRKALPVPDTSHANAAAAFVAPRTAAESVLAMLWSEVLGRPNIGVYDDFFALGGHSLLVTQLVSQVRSMFQIQVPIRALFEAPTIAQFTGVLIASEAKPGQVERIAQFLQRMRATANLK